MNDKKAIIILAAGKGKRMNSNIPKVLHQLNNITLIERVIYTARNLNCSKIIVVIGHKKEMIKTHLASYKDIEYAVQNEQKGTAHAVKMCFKNLCDFKGSVIILSGDVPLISTDTLKKLIETKNKTNAESAILTADTESPSGYGRIIRDQNGLLKKITEDKDCSDEELKINEINAGIYIVDNHYLINYIPKIKNENFQGEYYLPDLLNLMVQDRKLVAIYKTNNINEISGINSIEQLNQLEQNLTINEKEEF